MTLLPFVALFCWGLAMRRWWGDWLEALLAGLVCWGIAVSVMTELQSFAGMLTPLGSTVGWTVVGILGLVVRRYAPGRPPVRDPAVAVPIPALLPVLILLGLTGLVALVAAPNSYDGLSYHLPRVERWVAQGSLGPFATHDTRQLFMPSWAEYAILQLRLLSEGDRFANLVQWIGFGGMIGGAARFARGLGGKGSAPIAAMLAATIPMAVAQASGTQTDVVAACWAVISAAFGYRLLADDARPLDAIVSAAALGLAVATKQTGALFAGIVLIPVVVILLRRRQIRIAFAQTVASTAAILLLAGPQLARNDAVFGSIKGDPFYTHLVELEVRSPGVIGSNVLRNLSVHFGTPWGGLNQAITGVTAGVTRALGADPDDPRTTWGDRFRTIPWSTHEESAPNPLHLVLLAAAGLGFAVRRRPGPAGWVALGLGAGFLVFSMLFKWQEYSSRLQTPFFVLACAWMAAELDRWPTLVRRSILGGLFVAALPVALFNQTRPLVHWGVVTPRPSVLSAPRAMQYFLHDPRYAYRFADVAERIATSECNDVGLRNTPDAWEYALTVLVRSRGKEPRYRSLDVSNPSKRFAGPERAPCLLVQIGPHASVAPDWGIPWRVLANWPDPERGRSIALFALP